MNNTIDKQPYIIPRILEHHLILFETIISGNDSALLPDPKNSPDAPDRDHKSNPRKEHVTSLDRDQQSNRYSDQPLKKFPASNGSTQPTSTDHQQSNTDDHSFEASSRESGQAQFNSSFAEIDPSLFSVKSHSSTISKQEGGQSTLNLKQTKTEEVLSSSTDITTSIAAPPSKKHADSLQNEGSSPPILGIEGIILTGLSGMTLWAIKRRSMKD